MKPQNNLLTFTPGTVAQSAQVNQNFNDIVGLSGNAIGSSLQMLLSNSLNGFVLSYNGNANVPGGIITTASGLNANMSAAYIVSSGIVYYMPAQSFQVSASKDTYIDFVPGTTPTYVAILITNNTTSPALASSIGVRMGIIVSGASSISSINQGQPTAAAPVISSNVLAINDSIGNLIFPVDPLSKVLGMRVLTNQTASDAVGVATLIPGTECPVVVPAGKRVKVTLYGEESQGAGAYADVELWRGTVGSGTKLILGRKWWTDAGGRAHYAVTTGVDQPSLTAISSVTYRASIRAEGGGAAAFNGAGDGAIMVVEVF